MTRILITGNMGYVGPVLVAHLRHMYPQATLIGFDSGLFSHCLATSGPQPERLLDCQHFGDVRDFPGELLQGVDAVVHLAGAGIADRRWTKTHRAAILTSREAGTSLLATTLAALNALTCSAKVIVSG